MPNLLMYTGRIKVKYMKNICIPSKTSDLLDENGKKALKNCSRKQW